MAGGFDTVVFSADLSPVMIVIWRFFVVIEVFWTNGLYRFENR